MSTQLSPDGMYWWDGAAWMPVAARHGQAPGQLLQPTSWTQPLQVAVVAVFAAQALFAASVPFWFIATMTQWANAMNERYGAPTPPPEAQAASAAINNTMTAALDVAVVVGIILALAAIVVTLKRSTWAHYAITVLLGLQVLFSLMSLLNVLVPTLIVRATPPAPVVAPELTLTLIGVGLLSWMIVAAATRGPWGMRRLS